MITSKLRKSGNSYIVTVPREQVERMKLREGQLVSVEVRPVDVRPMLAADLRSAFEIEFNEGRAALQYLAEN